MIDPTQDEIVQRSLEVQKTWSKETRKKRLGIIPPQKKGIKCFKKILNNRKFYENNFYLEERNL